MMFNMASDAIFILEETSSSAGDAREGSSTKRTQEERYKENQTTSGPLLDRVRAVL